MTKVIITNTCADRCGAQLGTGREKARRWLTELVPQGRLTRDLPAPHTGKRSPSGRFLLVDGVLVLPLADNRDGGAPVAVNCIFFPEWLERQGLGGAEVDPFALRGEALLRHVRFSEHCVQRYTQRCGGPREPGLAAARLREVLAADAKAVPRRPDWSRSQRGADFFIVAQDEYCLPVQRYASDGRAFEAPTLLHRSQPLFELTGRSLEFACRFTDRVMADARALAEPGHDPISWLRGLIVQAGTLSWDPPPGWARYPGARFYIHAGPYHLPVAWEKDARRQLVALAVFRGRVPVLQRIAAWLRRRFGLRVA